MNHVSDFVWSKVFGEAVPVTRRRWMAKVWRCTKKVMLTSQILRQNFVKPQSVVYDINNNSMFIGFLLSEHVLIGKNETCYDRRWKTDKISNEHECKVAAKLLWPRNDIQFNAIRNIYFPKGCYIDQAEHNPVKKDVYFNNHANDNRRQYLSAPICRWGFRYPVCKWIIDFKKF